MKFNRKCNCGSMLKALVFGGFVLGASQSQAGEVKWAYEEVKENGFLDRAWMGNSKGGKIATPQKKGGLKGVAYTNEEAYEGKASLKFHVTKKGNNDWAFAAITCGDGSKGTEATSWDQVDAGQDISTCSHLELYIKGTGNLRLEIKDCADNGSGKVTIGDYAKIKKDSWSKVSIPLVDFGLDKDMLDVYSIKNINVLAEEAVPAGKGEWTLYIDNMGFAEKGSPIAKPFTAPKFTGTAVAPFEAQRWSTKVRDGKKQIKDMGNWTDDKLYDLEQNSQYTLFERERDVESESEMGEGNLELFIDTSKPLQKVMGLGASITDSSAYVLTQLKEKDSALYNYAMEMMFDKNKGAGFTAVRLPVGASDYTATEKYYTYCDKPGLENFTIEHNKKYILPILRAALKINPDIKFMGTPWSPPAWMKTNESLFGIKTSEKAKGKTNRLKPDHFEIYAKYLTKYVQAYKEEGVTISYLTLQNEPQFDGADYPCMRMTKDEQIKLTKILGPMLKNAGLPTKILVHDHNWVLHPNDKNVVGGDKKMDPLTLVKEIYADKEAAQYLAGSAWHCYSGGLGELSGVYSDLSANYPDKLILTTEASAWGKKRKWDWSGDITWGFTNNWLSTFEYGGGAALEWNMVLDHKYGPSLRHDSAAYGLLTVNTDTYKEVKFEREFYAMAHISKAMAGGAQRLSSVLMSNGKPSMQCKSLAFKRNDGKIGLFILNLGKKDAEITVSYKGQFLDVKMRKESMQTLVW